MGSHGVDEGGCATLSNMKSLPRQIGLAGKIISY